MQKLLGAGNGDDEAYDGEGSPQRDDDVYVIASRGKRGSVSGVSAPGSARNGEAARPHRATSGKLTEILRGEEEPKTDRKCYTAQAATCAGRVETEDDVLTLRRRQSIGSGDVVSGRKVAAELKIAGLEEELSKAQAEVLKLKMMYFQAVCVAIKLDEKGASKACKTASEMFSEAEEQGIEPEKYSEFIAQQLK